ncbi:MAG: hypothetical protein HBSAPP02_14320 [Phycisphaerae bacterium]|nr:MAG: hypothetical protein HRU71_07635 [Planctomycetia bacterium]RIK71284.1 MAG: hypothetical protein DCC66_01475 [Planctomycetota bacterium]GJQ26400.1 MAG: hypothetical protein HBSAPP02_14320 [Phycisphaerae bacterium]
MGLFDWLTKRGKALSQMTRQELRRQELLLDRERQQLHKKIQDVAAKKQEIFQRGREEKSPEVRRMLAQEFDLKTTEQLMMGRQLNIRSKEYLTVSRMRMLRENADRAKARGSRLGLISEKDLIALEKMIANDSITSEMYQERLDDMLQVSATDGESILTPGSKQVLDVWEQMDTGLISDEGQAFDEAERRVRERHQQAEGAS